MKFHYFLQAYVLTAYPESRVTVGDPPRHCDDGYSISYNGDPGYAAIEKVARDLWACWQQFGLAYVDAGADS